MTDVLQALLEDGVIDAIGARLMSGKEASVFVVERRGELLAAKVYKDREQRTFKATASYTEGREQTRNSRDKRAMGKRTNYGKQLVESSWRDMEYAALHEAFSAGVRVPEPVLLYENVLLMQLLVDENGNPAPRLADFDLPAEVAALLHREIYGQVRKLLMLGKIHGDLSAYNILIARDGPTMIDMPQIVDASGNNNAAEILRRDLANVTEHLARFDSRLLLFRDCGRALWEHYRRGDLDRATEPEQGQVRSTTHQGHRGRRARDAERGRAGRANDRNQRPDHRGHNDNHASHNEQRPPQQQARPNPPPASPRPQQHQGRPNAPSNAPSSSPRPQQHQGRPNPPSSSPRPNPPSSPRPNPPSSPRPNPPARPHQGRPTPPTERISQRPPTPPTERISQRPPPNGNQPRPPQNQNGNQPRQQDQRRDRPR